MSDPSFSPETLAIAIERMTSRECLMALRPKPRDAEYDRQLAMLREAARKLREIGKDGK